MNSVNWKAWISVVAAAFLGGMATHFTMPHEGMGMKQIAFGAVLAGLSAVAHLFQNPKKAELPASEEPKA